MRYTKISDKITDNSDFHRKQFQIKKLFLKTLKRVMLTFSAATLESKHWVTQCMIMFGVPKFCSVENVPQWDEAYCDSRTVCCAVKVGSTFWNCGWNPKVWPFKWKLLSSTFCGTHCALRCTRWCHVWNPKVWQFKCGKLLKSNFKCSSLSV